MLRLAGAGDTIPAGWLAPSYTFEMQYDSVSTTNYMFTECKRNGEPWKLAKWWNNRRVNADARLLSFNSRTVAATLHTGDTISFFRYLWWQPAQDDQDTSNYYALDSLDYAVELVRTDDSARIALLDSIGVLPNSTPARPRIHGMRSLMALVRYCVPAAFDGAEAFLRVRAYHRGSGPYWFTRGDGITAGVSNWLNLRDIFGRYIDLFQTGSSKYSAPALEALGTGPDTESRLSVFQLPGAANRISISFACTPDGRSTTIAVYDALGNLVFMPYLTASSYGSDRVDYRFEQSGTYFIALIYNGQLVATRKISIAL